MKFLLQNIIISKSTHMYSVLDKDIIKSEIVPYLPLAKIGFSGNSPFRRNSKSSAL